MLSRVLSKTELPIVVFVKNGRDILILDSDVSLPSIRESLQGLQKALGKAMYLVISTAI
jgi:hypothetical protein